MRAAGVEATDSDDFFVWCQTKFAPREIPICRRNGSFETLQAVQLRAVEIQRPIAPFACSDLGLELGEPAIRDLGKG
jgi:hypothetical protein